jgi:hypothetical protein
VAGQGRCADNEACNPNDGHCEPVPCDDGYTCPNWRSCVVPEGGDLVDRHGCVTAECTEDGQCNGDICVNGHCAPELGVCQLPVP